MDRLEYKFKLRKAIGKSVYVKNFIEEDLVNFRAKAKEDQD